MPNAPFQPYSHLYHHPPWLHSCDGRWYEGESERRDYSWHHDTSSDRQDPNDKEAR
ncbi:hypothetical protein [Streptomyces sp. NPDC059788]|uniref:hypothetical protein n=1 Tax=Streptomyces sp. NPDC059788 TaxID=3346948 RepID=UPI0036560ADF